MSDTAEQLAELSALTAGLAHEIRNPLSTLHVNLQLLDEDWRMVELPREGAHACDPQDIARRSRIRLATLLSETRRLERILADFLQYVGRRELEFSVQDMNVLVQELVDFFQAQASAHGVDVGLRLDPSPLPCRVDVNVFKQAALNLLINALEAMPDGGRLMISTSRTGGDPDAPVSAPDSPQARLDVSDTGPGVPAELREKIFQACFSTKRGGTGLGLAAARRMIQAHGGKLALSSSTDGGSRFSLWLPIVKPQPPTAALESDAPPMAALQSDPLPATTPRPSSPAPSVDG